MQRIHQACSAGLAIALFTGVTLAQVKTIIVLGAEDIDATGTKTVGRYSEWLPGPDFRYVPYVWERGANTTRVPGDYRRPTTVKGSADLSALMMDLHNASNWGDLNCFAGYCFQSELLTCSPLGAPLTPPNPCILPNVTHRYTASTGWVNAGSLPRLFDSATGRWYGGTRCDQTINSPNDISGNGRYIVGGAYSAQLFHSAGGPGFGLCGDFKAFVYDGVTGSFTALPSVFNSRTTRADRVNFDGSVITGYDLESINHPNGTQDNWRRLAVWVNGVETILDPISHINSSAPVNGPGNVVAGSQSSAFNQATYGQSGLRLTRWVRQPNDTWTPQNLGRPADRFEGLDVYILTAMFPSAISDDGNTIVGTALYGTTARPFIWRPTINGGVPIDLIDYIASIDPSNPLLQPGLQVQFVSGASADGNAILVDIWDARNTCTNGGLSHKTGYTGIIYLNGAAVACEPPRIITGPSDWAVEQDLNFGAAFNVAAAGSFPLNYQWQREDPNSPGTWIDLVQDCSSVPDPNHPSGETGFAYGFSYEGVLSTQLRVGIAGFNVCDRVGNYRVVISNACGSVTSAPAAMTVIPPHYRRQPEDAAYCPGDTLTFSVHNDVIDQPFQRWQMESPAGSGTFIDIYDGFFFDPSSGATFLAAGALSRDLAVSSVDFGSSTQIVLRHQIDAYTICGGQSESETAVLSMGVCCTADFDDSGNVDATDIFIFLDAWFAQNGQSGPGLSADFDGTGTVDATDIFIFLDAWFAQNGQAC